MVGYAFGLTTLRHVNLRHARAQKVVQMHDADRLGAVGDEQRRDLRGCENLQRLAGHHVAPIVFGFFVITSSTVAAIRSGPMWRRKSPSVTMPARWPRASVMPTQAKALRRHLDQRIRHPGAERLQRHRVAGMHEIAGVFEQSAELAAGMQAR